MSTGDTITDGRRARGERRRRALIEATFRVVERDGPSGVTHRRIAKEAGVPAASVGYYFDSIDDLLVATLLESVEDLIREIERLREVTPPDGRRWAATLAELLAHMIKEQRARTLAECELYLLAARRPALRPAARRWRELAAGWVNEGRGADPPALAGFFAAIDGLLLHGLIAERPPTPEELEPTLHYLLQPIGYLQRIGELPESVGKDAGDQE